MGDLAGAAAGVYLIVRSMQVGLPRIVLVQMAINVIVDTVVGFVPILGDAFDFVYKANMRNVRLFERHALEPDHSTRGSWVFVAAIIAAIVGVLALLVWLAVAIFDALVAAL
ncbi:MAG: DUF4112 domain-containing protein [Chloroflexi bacterium]|nr:DUF4112 domain-containing protein [Chloroflexota bacterium]